MLSQQHHLDITQLTVSVTTNDKDEAFIVELSDKHANGSTSSSQVLRQWKDFVQLDRLVRSMAPKFDAPQMPVVDNATREELREYMQVYLSAAITCNPLKHLKEFQDFLRFNEYIQQERQRTFVTDYKFATLRHVASQQQLLLQQNYKPRSPLELRRIIKPEGKETAEETAAEEEEREYSIRGSSVAAEQREEVDEAENTLDECFRIMDVGAAGYITLEDMKEFFLCANVNSEMLQLRKDELCNRKRFAEVVRQTLRNANITLTLDEWIDRYWLQQYRKIYAAIPIFLNWEGDWKEFGRETMNGFDGFELATLMYVLTEAGLRLLSTLEISEWVQSKRYQRSCELTMDQFAVLLDALSKAVPFAELWLSLLPNSNNNSKMLQLIYTYAAIADVTVVEELQEHIMQLQRRVAGTTRDGGKCVNCSRVEETLRKQSAQLEAEKVAKETLMAKMRYLEQQLEERLVELTQLQEEHQHTQMLLEDADLRQAELMETLENSRLQNEGRSSSFSGAMFTHTAVSLPATTTLLQLLPCSTTAAAAAEYRREVNVPTFFIGVLNTKGAVAYAIPSEFSCPSHWSVGVFFCGEGTTIGGGKTERLVFRDADGRRSCAFLFKNNELHVLVKEKNSDAEKRKGVINGNNSRRVFRLTSRRWYTLNCFLNWKEKTFSVSLKEDDDTGGGSSVGVGVGNMKKENNKGKGSDNSILTKSEEGVCGPFTMIDEQVNGITVVDIFPRTELLVCYCNFFLHSTMVPSADEKVMEK
ncbi:uncharacterized protein TM35_000371010 [Trypanosoma theileri]|uniref:EF-hand domain-containing protein n=1 Tax=Trypanosoma theileri TaxID=67003 RepID=A0A1X0NKU1_9TRYP|nr:uncharacterized protein TM35_000371010 [Trypanosoma theileri]ORC85128.1 hypothetical protein TM35_000371010 [Trypanosoma theileri]